MRSKVAESVRREHVDEVQRLSTTERVALALQLGERDVEAFMAFQHVDRQTAVKAIRGEHQKGRRYSRCMDESPK